jgi:hypothetical protein
MKHRTANSRPRPPAPAPPRGPGFGPWLAAAVVAAIVVWSVNNDRPVQRSLPLQLPDAGLPVALAAQPRLLDPAAPPLVEPQPWAATPESSPPAPSGQVHAWQVRPAPPDPNAVRPVDPAPPPDPMTTLPPMENPGGVSGSRPPR